ncbi:MAG: alpha/beta fold hydrolase [Melioribacteraceae bacterium]|nr:alpha/beta fold hydrolase [Melioribacteraceae bacterium]
MKKFIACLMIFIFLSAVSTAQQVEKQSVSLWEGKLNISGVSLRLVLKVTTNDDGSLTAKMDSPDQSVENIPVTFVSITDDSLNFEIASIMGKYSGKIEKDSMVAIGMWKQATMSLPLNLKKVEKLTEVKRPQTPQPPFPYNEEEVVFENKTANIQLAGTFTYPKENQKFPAVVLVTGSGAQDRDETIFKHKPFMVIADYLSRNGIAVLRFDDRGIGKSTGNFSAATSIDFATDALAAVDYLKTRNEIDQTKIGIAGHSEGGMIAPIAASSSDDVAFIILLAGPGMRGSDLLVLQTELILRAEGTPQDKLDESVKNNKGAYKIIVDQSDSALAYKELEKFFDDRILKLPEEEKNKQENSRAAFEQSARILLSPWFRFFLKFDPKPYLENLTIPVLALNGEKDLQVPPKENLAGIEEALKIAGNTNYRIYELPGLNHLFQNSKTGSPREYGEIEETFSVEALKIISDWIIKVAR